VKYSVFFSPSAFRTDFTPVLVRALIFMVLGLDVCQHEAYQLRDSEDRSVAKGLQLATRPTIFPYVSGSNVRFSTMALIAECPVLVTESNQERT